MISYSTGEIVIVSVFGKNKVGIEITAISVVPPPISITMFPTGSNTCKPAPIEAAIGSSMV